MKTNTLKEVVNSSRKIVVKVGSSLIVDGRLVDNSKYKSTTWPNLLISFN